MPDARLPAKLSRPHLFDAFERDRLFGQLDALALRPLTWIAGPPGSGKTTLASSYLQKRKTTTLWYRVDEGDADAASVFSYLTQAMRGISRKHALNLPALRLEYLPDLPGFTRRYFRALFEMLPASSALVFDNYENAGANVLDTLLAIAVDELPHGTRILVTSRERPPEGLAHLETRGSMKLLLWDELRLTAAEAQAIADSAHPQSTMPIQPLHELCDGWVAGFVALLDHARRATTLPLESIGARESLFAYFVNETFARNDEPTRRVLVRTALMPAFTLDDAKALCPESGADMIVQQFYRQHYFISRSAGLQPVYRFHALFRGFLLDQGRLLLTPEERTQCLQHAGKLLENRGLAEESLALFNEARAWPDAARVICAIAPGMLDSGRNAVLTQAINALPQSSVNDLPWLGYWLGMARLPVHPAQARSLLEAAFARFEAADDASGCVLSSAGIIESYYLGRGNVAPIDRWAEAYDKYSRRPNAFPSDAAEIRTLAGFFAVFFRGDRHAQLLERVTTRALHLISVNDQPAQRIVAANFVCWLLASRGDYARLRPLLAEIEPIAAMPGVPPVYQILWQILMCWQAQLQGAFTQASAAIESAETIAREHGIRLLDSLIASHGAISSANMRNIPKLRMYADRMRAAVNPDRLIDVANFDYVLSLLALSQGDAASATRHAAASVGNTLACGATGIAAKSRVALGHALLQDGNAHEALAEAQRIIDEAATFRKGSAEHSGLKLKAGALRALGRMDEALTTLRQALLMGRENDSVVIFPWVPQRFLQWTYAWALREGIETHYVRGVIEKLNVTPPVDAGAHWPWPVRIYTLGRFEVVVNDTRLEYSRKQPKRPLALLKFLLARRGQVRMEQAIDSLWPDEEMDAAANALDAALHRLRRMLGSAHAVELQDGLLSLDRTSVWVDALAFEQLLDARHDGPDGQELRNQALKLYQGHFLSAETRERWSIAAHARLRARYVQAVVAEGQSRQSRAEHVAAAEHFQRAIEIDDTVEDFYVGLMQSQLAQGHRGEGLATYERLKSALAVELHLTPGPAAENIRNALSQTQKM